MKRGKLSDHFISRSLKNPSIVRAYTFTCLETNLLSVLSHVPVTSDSSPCVLTLLMTWHPYFSLYLLNFSVWFLLSLSTSFLSHTVPFHLGLVISQMIINKVLYSVHKNNIRKLACCLNSPTSLQQPAESNITGNIDCCTIPKWNTNLHIYLPMTMVVWNYTSEHTLFYCSLFWVNGFQT